MYCTWSTCACFIIILLSSIRYNLYRQARDKYNSTNLRVLDVCGSVPSVFCNWLENICLKEKGRKLCNCHFFGQNEPITVTCAKKNLQPYVYTPCIFNYGFFSRRLDTVGTRESSLLTISSSLGKKSHSWKCKVKKHKPVACTSNSFYSFSSTAVNDTKPNRKFSIVILMKMHSCETYWFRYSCLSNESALHAN